MKLRFLYIFLVLFTSRAYSSTCTETLNPKALEVAESQVGGSGFKTQNRRIIHYPVNIQLMRLGLSSFSSVPKQSEILVIGDGYSGLGLGFHEAGQRVTLIDPAYGARIDFSGLNETSERQVRLYDESLSDRMFSGSALSTPFENDSFDLILSHLLLNNLGEYESIPVFAEALRILKPQGEAFFVTQMTTTNIGISSEDTLAYMQDEPEINFLRQDPGVDDFDVIVIGSEVVDFGGQKARRFFISIEFSKK